jgi:hypothetical protein
MSECPQRLHSGGNCAAQERSRATIFRALELRESNVELLVPQCARVVLDTQAGVTSSLIAVGMPRTLQNGLAG